MDKSKANSIALKLINDIALVDSDIAAKIKPSIDMFVESLESTLSNNDLFNQLTEFFKLTDDNAKKQWLSQHQELANKINEIFDSMNGVSKPITEDNDNVNKDVPIVSKEKKKDPEVDPEIPEDKFKHDEEDNGITVPLEIKDDDKRLMGKKPPKESELNPNNKPKVEDVTPDSEVKLPDLSKMKTTLESIRALYKESMKDKVMSLLKENKIIIESFVDHIDGIDDKYVQYLNDRQFDDALTNIENNTPQYMRFIPIRKYASQLYKKFKEDFSSYDEAMKIAKEWYANRGRSRYQNKKKVPGRIYVELRHISGTDFEANIYLVKPIDSELGDKLSYSDQELASDMNETYTGEYSDDIPDLFKPMKKVTDTEFGKSNVWKMSIPFPKDVKHNIPISKIKHDIVDFVNKNYKDTHIASSKMPNWLYSYAAESLDESVDTDIKSIIFNVFQEIFDEYAIITSDEDMDYDDAYQYIVDKFINNFEDYDIPRDIEADITGLDIDEIENYVDDFLAKTRETLET